MIKMIEGVRHYFDKNGDEIFEGDLIKIRRMPAQRVYLAKDGQLGTDATNPLWVAFGRAAPCQFGIWPLTREDTDDAELVGSED